ncbi:MAG: glycine cleavage system aminomethyltransferase GcvT [Bacillota bacterium]
MQGIKTPLYDIHIKYGGRIVEFGGWLLPVQYSGILEEHRAVRTAAGLFDVSHMGEMTVAGREAFDFLQHLVTNDLTGMRPGRARYSPVCYEDGGTVDDVLVYMVDDGHFMLVVNASNTAKDHAWILEQSKRFDCIVENISGETAELSLQGPASVNILQRMIPFDLAAMKYYTFVEKVEIGGFPVLLSRTGYTGEDGFEIYCAPVCAAALWEMIMEEGRHYGIKPAGLGARDTLRLEAGMPLYGHELSEEITPLEAGLDKFVKLEKTGFIGRESLLSMMRDGPVRRLAGLEMLERGIPRHGCPVWDENRVIGIITSGSYAPTLDKNIALALLESAYARPGSGVMVEIRDKRLGAVTVDKLFYKRGKRE